MFKKYSIFLFLGLVEAVEAGNVSKLSKVLQEKDKVGYKNFNVNGYKYRYTRLCIKKTMIFAKS